MSDNTKNEVKTEESISGRRKFLKSGAIAAAMESSLLFCGHVLVILCNENRKTPIPTFNEHLAVVLQLSAKRAINSNLPSCIKSFILPIAYNAALVPDTVGYLGSL